MGRERTLTGFPYAAEPWTPGSGTTPMFTPLAGPRAQETGQLPLADLGRARAGRPGHQLAVRTDGPGLPEPLQRRHAA